LTPVGSDGLFAHGGRFDAKTVHQKLPATSAGRQYELKIGNVQAAAAHLYELLNVASDTEVIGRWASRFAEGQAAMTSRKVGKGNVIYLGTYLTDALVELLVEQVLAQAGITPLIADIPTGVEAAIRESKDRRLLFILNTLGESTAAFGIPSGTTLLSDGSRRGDSLVLPAYGCCIIELDWP